jgi:RHS repeat-associated protein
MQMPGRNGGEDYRYAFNGMEKDDEVKGSGNSYDFGARMLDTRLGRWLSTDPKAAIYPELSPFAFVANMPIIAIDPDGQEIWIKVGQKKFKYVDGKLFDRKGTEVLSAPKTALRIANDVKILQDLDPVTNGIINDLSASKKRHVIKGGKNNSARGNKSKFRLWLFNGRSGTEISYDIDGQGPTIYKTSDDNKVRRSEGNLSSLAHELTHGWMFDRGMMGALYQWIKTKTKLRRKRLTEEGGPGVGILEAEILPMTVENIVAKYEQEPTRIQYLENGSYKPVPDYLVPQVRGDRKTGSGRFNVEQEKGRMDAIKGQITGQTTGS